MHSHNPSVRFADSLKRCFQSLPSSLCLRQDLRLMFPQDFLWSFSSGRNETTSSPCNPDLCVPLQLLWESCSPLLPVSTSQVAVLSSWFLLSTGLPNIMCLCFSRWGSGSGIRSASDRECCLGDQGRFLAAGKLTLPDFQAMDCWLPSCFQLLRSLEREQLLILLTIPKFFPGWGMPSTCFRHLP